MDKDSLKNLLETLYNKYNNTDFIESDPISIPHSFGTKENIEISGFFASVIAWGNRKAIVKSAMQMMKYMDNQPYDFIINASEKEILQLSTFVYRTFNGQDFMYFVHALRQFCIKFGSIGNFFEQAFIDSRDIRIVLSRFRYHFFEIPHEKHCEKHLSSIDKGAACKRLNMYLRWMVRRDRSGVDFGLWEKIPMSALYLPLDVHSGNMGRALGLLKRKQNDWKAVEEITQNLREFDANDPVRFDFSLFGAGINQLKLNIE
ncbi:MAG: TIGR02757 family protein [Prevotellaceae bacterium]|nr:TIGR02757 family protein [Prevotellaceae bacterium]